jgi:hypothetical protein
MKFTHNALLVCLPALIQLTGYTQPNAGDSVNNKRLTTVGLAAAVGYGGSMLALNQLWYAQHPRQPFRFFDDAGQWKQADKFGHLYATYVTSRAATQLLLWARMPKKKAAIWGTAAGFAMTSSIEVFDGFSAGWGASPTDLAANAVGAGVYLAQELGWKEVRIHPKFSFHQTSLAAMRPDVLGSGWQQEMVKDYNGHTYWFSVDMDKFMPFPAWLNLCVGYGAHNMIRGTPHPNDPLTPFRQYYLGVDFDLTAIRTRSKLVRTLVYAVNMVRLPAPAIEFSRHGVSFHPVYF